MDIGKLLTTLRKLLDCKTEKQLSKELGVTQQTIVNWKNKGELSNRELTNLLTKTFKAGEKYAIDTQKLLPKLKSGFGVKTDAALAEKLGVTGPAINNYNKTGYLTLRNLVNLFRETRSSGIEEGKAELLDFPFRPIVEFYRCDATYTSQGASFHVFDKNRKREQQIAKLLSNAKGIYVFYDSQGRPIYIGKAKDQSLWRELKHAYNRSREHAQKIWRVSHPTTGQSFSPASENPRKIALTETFLYETAHYFSAYRVNENMIEDVEALLIRTFANVVTNTRIERFPGSRTK